MTKLKISKVKDWIDSKRTKKETIQAFDPTYKKGVAGIRSKIKKSINRDIAVLVHMHLRNGKEQQFQIYPKGKKSFSWAGGEYIIDPDMLVENVSANMQVLHYHQDICIPINFGINVTELTQAVESGGDLETEKAINPYTLKQFINSDVIEKVLKGEELEKRLKSLKFFAVISAIMIAATLLILINETGMLQNLNLPF